MRYYHLVPARKAIAWHLFFDTTELRAGKIPNDRLLAAAKETGSQLYVCELVLVVLDTHTQIGRRRRDLEPYLTFEFPRLPAVAEIEKAANQNIRERLREFTVIPTQGLTTEDLHKLLAERDRRRTREQSGVPSGVNDAVILLSGMKYAQEKRLSPCIFVSANTRDMSPDVVAGLGRVYGSEWRIIADTTEVISLISAPGLTAAATEFMRAHEALIRDYVRSASQEFGVDEFRIEDIEAYVQNSLPEDADVELELDFHATLWKELPSVPLLTPESIGGGITFSKAAILHAQSGYYGILLQPSLPIEGKASVRFQRGRFVGKPTIRTVRLREPLRVTSP